MWNSISSARVMRRWCRTLTVIALASGATMASSDALPTLDTEAEAWVQSTLASMTLEQRAAQLIKPAVPANAPGNPEVLAEYGRMVSELGVGGFTFRVRSARDAVEILNSLQASSEVPLLVSVNFERGTGTFWEEGTIFPRQMACAATGDPDAARTVGVYTAREGLACGIPWTLVPIADVNINPENPIINIRSYGEDVDTVSACVRAFVEGCQGEGMLACAKHYPGHGDTATDSHLELAVVDEDLERLRTVEFPPFQEAIDSGVATVMTSHIWFPALMGDEGEIPATISRNVLTGLLREEMGFEGLVVTDAMSMRGIRDRLPPGEAAAAAVAAGSDMLLDPLEPWEAHAGIVRAVREGTLPEERVNEACERILRAKAGLGLQHSQPVDVEAAMASLGQPDALEAAQGIARRAFTVVRDEQSLLPIDPEEHARVLHISLYDAWSHWNFRDFIPLANGLNTRFESVRYRVAFDPPDPDVTARLIGDERSAAYIESVEHLGLDGENRAAIMEEARRADLILISAFVRTASYKSDIGLGENQIALIRSLAAGETPVALAVFGSPYLLTELPSVPCQILTYDDSYLFTGELPGALVGEFPLSGRLPVTLPGIAERGEGVQVPARH